MGRTPMISRILSLVIATCMASGLATGQTSDKELPSAPSATAEQNSPEKSPPPAGQEAPPPKAHPDNELKPGDNTKPESQAPAGTASDKAGAAADPQQSSSDGKSSASANNTASSPSPLVSAPQQPPGPALVTPPGFENQDEARDPAATITIGVNEVRVIFTVTDKHGRYIKDLKKTDFRVIDDNKPAQEIRSFHAETDLPLQVGLLVDASNSVRDRFKFEQESAIEFLNQTVRPKYDKAFVLGFDVTADLTQDFTDNTEALSRGVRALRPGGGTAMYDALYKACRDKLLKAAETQTGPARRAVILLRDGDDNQSRVTREEAIEMAQRAEVIVYTISTDTSNTVNSVGEKVLQRISEATGGRSFRPFKLEDVADA